MEWHLIKKEDLPGGNTRITESMEGTNGQLVMVTIYGRDVPMTPVSVAMVWVPVIGGR
jgi:hypothetical protein